MHRGEIYLVDLNQQIGSEQSGIRPALIVQNEKGNQFSPTTIVCPLTTSKTKHLMVTHVSVCPDDCGVAKDSIVLCEQIRVVDKTRIGKKIGEINNRRIIDEINNKLLISIGIAAN